MNSIAKTSIESLEHLLGNVLPEIGAHSALVLRSDGQVLLKQGLLGDEWIPHLAALVAAMASASQSVAAIAKRQDEGPRFSLEFPSSGLYAIGIDSEHWLAVLYEDVLNPGLLRMKTRNFGRSLAEYNFKEDFIIESAVTAVGSTVAPSSPNYTPLFENITDDEIDRLFTSP